MTDHQAEVERLLAEYRRSREQLAAAHKALAAISVTEASDDGAVAVTVAAQGTLTGLDIAADAYRRYRPADLAALIVELTSVAAGQAAVEAQRVLEPVLPAGADPAASLAGTADLQPHEIVPDSCTTASEDSLAELSWLEQAHRGRLT